MGTDISAVYQTNEGKSFVLDFERNYNLFGFLAGARGRLEPLVKPRGWPEDITQESLGSLVSTTCEHTWYHIDELLSVDYGKVVEGFALRTLLGDSWFTKLEFMKSHGPGRLLIGFF